jgi:hypothetical protein
VDIDVEYGIQRGTTILGVYDALDEARLALYRTAAPSGSYPRLVQRGRSTPDGRWTAVVMTGGNPSISVVTVEEHAGQLLKNMVTGPTA